FPCGWPRRRARQEARGERASPFLPRSPAGEGRRVNATAAGALDLLPRHSWPGNVRQLENAVFRAVVLADGPELTVAEFPQIAAQVEGFQTAIPAAPAAVDRRPVITGPGMLGAENSGPRTLAGARPGGTGARGIPA